MKAVFDTNVLVSAFLTEGVCAKLLLRARRKQFELVLCPCILDEFRKILRSKISAPPGEIRAALELIHEACVQVARPESVVAGVCRDSDDDAVLDCLAASGAEYLVTGDADLLELHPFRGTPILKPRDFEALFLE